MASPCKTAERMGFGSCTAERSGPVRRGLPCQNRWEPLSMTTAYMQEAILGTLSWQELPMNSRVNIACCSLQLQKSCFGEEMV